jgi:PTH1 family peptidyl-tRNA hydrolase
MKLVFALGNPGSEYVGTRHNTGFIIIDKFAHEHGVSFSEKTKFRAYIAELSLAGDKVLLVKPTTFYNNVGESARSLIDFYKLNLSEDLLVIHDDLALPFGTIRVRGKGSDAGNNGIKSLNALIGPDYARLRIGISTEDRTSEDASFVLSRFNNEETSIFKEVMISKTFEFINDFLFTELNETSYSLPTNSTQ